MTATSGALRSGRADLRVDVGGLRLRSPLLAAAGCAGYGGELARLGVLTYLGALVTPTLTAHGLGDGPPLVLVESPSGLLYAGRRRTPALAQLTPSTLPWARLEEPDGTEREQPSAYPVPVIVSLGGADEAEFSHGAAELRRRHLLRPGSAVEVDLAAPDAENAGRSFCADPAGAADIVRQVRLELPADIVVLAKVAGSTGTLVETANAVTRAGADVLVVTAALPASLPARPCGAHPRAALLSGPAVAPVTLRAVHDLSRARRDGRLAPVPVVAGGGISTGRQVDELLAAGASAVQLGTTLLHDPISVRRIHTELADHLHVTGRTTDEGSVMKDDR